MSKNLEETEKFLNKHCLQRCNHNSNESCICKVAICLKEIEKAQEQEKVINELIRNHIEFVVEKDRCYFKIKNSKGNEKSFTSYTMLDFWKEVLKNE